MSDEASSPKMDTDDEVKDVGATATDATEAVEGTPQRKGHGKGKGEKKKGKGKGKSKDTARGSGRNAHDDVDPSSAGKSSRKGGGGSRRTQKTSPSPTTLGAESAPAVLGLPAASRGGQRLQCLLCCVEGPAFMAVGRCGHAEVCWICALRLRALSQNRRCTLCKTELDEVLFVGGDLNKAPAKDSWTDLPLNEEFGIRFADDRVQAATAKLFEYTCSLDECRHHGRSFGTFHELENHVWYAHWRMFCKVCLLKRPAFLSEQRVYSSQEMDQHCRQGDNCLYSACRDLPHVPAHPRCEFCKRRFYNEDELIKHMYQKHHQCQICERTGQRNQFYFNWRCLALHYQESHHVCAHKTCQRGGLRLVAFRDEDELEHHYVREHSDVVKLGEREKGIRLQVGQLSYAAGSTQQQRNHQGGKGKDGKGKRGRDSNAQQDTDDSRVYFVWPTGGTKEDWTPDITDPFTGEPISDSDEEGTMSTRYPPRDPALSAQAAVSGLDDEATPSAECDTRGQLGHENDDGCLGVAAASSEWGSLHPRLRDLPVDCIIAADGPKRGQGSCLNALGAVLEALVNDAVARDENEDDQEESFREVVDELTAAQAESLEQIAKHMGERKEFNAECDRKSLERVLALRPRFFLLLKGVRGESSTTGERDTQPEPWKSWKLVAQSAVLSLSDEARSQLLRYVTLCLERRSRMRAFSLDDDDMLGDSKKESFPTLGKAGAGTQGAASAWSEFRQAAQSRKKSEDVADGTSKSRSGDRSGTPVGSPSLAPASGPRQSEANAFEGVSDNSLPSLLKPFEGITDEAFPSLGGSPKTKTAPAPCWGAKSKLPAPDKKTLSSSVVSTVSPKTAQTSGQDEAAPGKVEASTVLVEEAPNHFHEPQGFGFVDTPEQFPELTAMPPSATKKPPVLKNAADADVVAPSAETPARKKKGREKKVLLTFG